MFSTKVTFKSGGKEVSGSGIGDALAEAVMDAAKKQIRDKIESVRCPVHGGNARAEFKEGSDKQLRYEIHGCCDSLVQQVKKSLDAQEA